MNASLAVCALALLLAGGCSDDELPPVWIAKLEPTVAPAGATVRLFGRGLGAAPASAGADAAGSDDTTAPTDSVCARPTGVDAVLVGGQPAEVCVRTGERIDLIIPRLPAGPQHVVVRSGGVTSNAMVLRVIATTSE